jgi:transposase-like protein
VDPILEKYLMGKPAGGVYSPDNINLYNYVGNNPIKYFDPNGKNKASYGYATMEQIIEMVAAGSYHKTVCVPIVDNNGTITGFYSFTNEGRTSTGAGMVVVQRHGNEGSRYLWVDEYEKDSNSGAEGRFAWFTVERKEESDYVLQLADDMKYGKRSSYSSETTYFNVSPDKRKREAGAEKAKEDYGISRDKRKVLFLYMTDEETSDNAKLRNTAVDVNVYDSEGNFIDHDMNQLKGKNIEEIKKLSKASEVK